MNDQSPTPNNMAHAVIYLSGSRRGSTELLGENTRLIAREGRGGVRIARPASQASAAGTTTGSNIAAVLHRTDGGYELEAMPEQELWVNGERATSKPLASGDVLELGHNGPMLRYRTYQNGTIPRRSMSDVFADCRDGARYEQGPLVRKTGIFVGGMTREFLNRTTLAFRFVVMLSLGGLFAVIGLLMQQNTLLEERIARGETETQGLALLIREGESKAITEEDLVKLRGELEGNITTTVERVEAVEQRFGAAARVVSAASRSVIFLQGSYGFVHTESGRALRYLEVSAPDKAKTGLRAGRAVTLGGDGPLVEIQYTGTGYIATDDGMIITNRHVAQPWRNEDFTAMTEAMGLTPVSRRFIGYLPGRARSFEVALAGISDEADVAILKCSDLEGVAPALRATASAPKPGDEVIVLGFPTGVRAMLARTGESFLEKIRGEGDLDFWTIGEKLAEAGHIEPLATRGIVGQVSSSVVVYDAGTTHGGSGGPVLNLEGQVIAVNAAILKEFGGSNLGVPVARATTLAETYKASR